MRKYFRPAVQIQQIPKKKLQKENEIPLSDMAPKTKI